MSISRFPLRQLQQGQRSLGALHEAGQHLTTHFRPVYVTGHRLFYSALP
jgi:hypothetical protein